MVFSPQNSSQSFPLYWSCSEEEYHLKLQNLSKRSCFERFIVKDNEGLLKVKFWDFFLEKTKNILGWNPDWSNKKLIDYHIIQFIAFGVEKQWITTKDQSALNLLASRVNGLQQIPAASHKNFEKKSLIDELFKSIFQKQSTSPSLSVSTLGSQFYQLHAKDLKPFIHHIEHFQKQLFSLEAPHFPIAEKNEIIITATDQNKNQFDVNSWTPLHHAVADNKPEITMAMIKDHPEMIFQADKDGRTPLHIASYLGCFEAVKLLIAAGADLHNADKRDATALLFAADGGHLEIVKELLYQGADIKTVTNQGTSVLHFAASRGNLKVVERLVESGADVQAKTIKGTTPLHWAVRKGHLEVSKFLLIKGADCQAVDNSGWTPLHLAASKGYLNIVELLVESGTDIQIVDGDGDTALHIASDKGFLEIVKFFLTKGANVQSVNKEGITPLYFAANNGHLEIVKELLYQGADIKSVSNKGVSALHLAAFAGHLSVVKLLIEGGADIQEKTMKGGTPLHLAAREGHLEVSKFLLMKGADCQSIDNYGWTPLHEAASKGYLNIVELLFENEADIHIPNENGDTAFHMASGQGFLEIVKFFITKGANVQVVDNEGLTALHCASRNGHLEISRFLLMKGADCQSIDSFGWTPLHEAASKGHLSVVKLLIESGADIQLEDKNGVTALELTALNKHFAVAELLINKGTDLLTGNLKINNFLFTVINAQDNESKEFIKKMRENNALNYIYAKECQQRKLIAHIVEIQGTNDLIFKDHLQKFKTIDLEGWLGLSHSYLWKKFIKSFETFIKELPDLMDVEAANLLIQTFQSTMESTNDPLRQFLRWQSGKPIVLESGYKEHYTSVLFWDNQYILCNRNQKPPLQIYTFDKALLDEKIVRDICKIKNQPEEESLEFFSKTLPTQLKFLKTPPDQELDCLPISLQLISNCSWANSEGIILPFLMLHAIKTNQSLDSEQLKNLKKKQVATFEHWKSFLLIEILNQYMHKLPKRSSSILTDFNLLATAFAKKYPKHDMDPRLIQKWQKGNETFLNIAPTRFKISFLFLKGLNICFKRIKR